LTRADPLRSEPTGAEESAAVMGPIRRRRARQQLRYLAADRGRIVNGRWWREWTVWFTGPFLVVACYRLDRAGCLLLGRWWPPTRILLTPLVLLLYPWTADIHYLADIGPGLLILHPSLGVVISGQAKAGCNLTLVGGNCLGMRRGHGSGPGILLGDRVQVQANAVVLGPVVVGDGATIGAGAVVLHDVSDGDTVVGVPAIPIGERRSHRSPPTPEPQRHDTAPIA
jgi:serine acetyltransferase